MAQKQFKLVDEQTGQELKQGDRVISFRGEAYALSGWKAPPLYSSSTGRVYLRSRDSDSVSEFYPSVINAKFVLA